MKKLLSISLLLFINFSISQTQISYEAIWLNEGMEEQYIEVEKFWSEIKKEAISRDLQNGWVVWKVIKDPENESHSNKPDYIVMNAYKDEDQRKKQVNWEELEEKLTKENYQNLSTKRNLENGKELEKKQVGFWLKD